MVKEETPSSYLPDWMPGMMSPNLLSTHSVVKPIFLATASKRSTSNPTILPFSLNSLGGYVSSVPILSFPTALMPAGTLATRPGSASVVGVGPPVPPPFFSSPHAANDSVSASPAASPSAAPLRKVVRNIALSYVDGGHDAVGACCQATPRYASLTAGSCSRSSPLPLLTIRPVSSTYPRCARVSACCAFCSTSRIVVPCWLISVMIEKICWISIGASPIDGSSSSISFGRLISARPTASICCSPPDNVPPGCLRRSANRGKRLKTRSMSARTAPPSRGHGSRLQPLPPVGRATQAARWHIVRRRTADACRRSRADEPAEADAARRAVDGAGADADPADLLDHHGDQPAGHDDPAGRTERAAGADAGAPGVRAGDRPDRQERQRRGPAARSGGQGGVPRRGLTARADRIMSTVHIGESDVPDHLTERRRTRARRGTGAHAVVGGVWRGEEGRWHRRPDTHHGGGPRPGRQGARRHQGRREAQDRHR